ncbi:MAG: DUF4381 domain-containing protein [Chromatiales bacterium]
MNPEEIPLRDIHPPAPVSWWPPAPGWGILALLIIAAVTWLLMRGWLRRHHTRATATTLSEEVWGRWRQIHALRSRGTDDSTVAAELSSLVRQVALSAHPRHEVAGLTGQAWLAFLDQGLGGEAFRAGAGRLLATVPYRGVEAVDMGPCLDLCEQWLRATLARLSTSH